MKGIPLTEALQTLLCPIADLADSYCEGLYKNNRGKLKYYSSIEQIVFFPVSILVYYNDK